MQRAVNFGYLPQEYSKPDNASIVVIPKELCSIVQVGIRSIRDGALSSSTLKEACSWGKVDTGYEQMVYAEATSVLPLVVSYVYHMRSWETRQRRKWNKIFE